MLLEDSGLEVSMFGELLVCWNGRTLFLRGRGIDRVFARLLLFPCGVSNEELLAEISPGGGSNSLHQSLSLLRKVLGEELAPRLEVKNQWVRFDTQGARIDVTRFDNALKSGAIEEANALYTAPLLSKWTEPWAVKERRQRADLLAERLRDLAERTLPEEAGRIWRRYAELRPQEERGWRRCAEAYLAMGEATLARNALKDFEAVARRGSLTVSASMMLLLQEAQTPIMGDDRLPYETILSRPVEHELGAALARHDAIVVLQGPRQSGKSVVLARALQRVRMDATRVVRTDLSLLEEGDLVSFDILSRRLSEFLADRLDLPPMGSGLSLPPAAQLEKYLRGNILLPDVPRLVWAIDDVDRVFGRAFDEDFFRMFRRWHGLRTQEPDGPFARLCVVLVCATEARLYLRNPNTSPFNVVQPYVVGDFTSDEVRAVLQSHGVTLTQSEFDSLRHLIGGHPALVNRAAQALRDRRLSVEVLSREALHEDGAFGGEARRFFARIRQEEELSTLCRKLLEDKLLDREGFWKLRSAGVATGTDVSSARFRCGLYERVLQEWLTAPPEPAVPVSTPPERLRESASRSHR
ncbi:MAG: AAA-like domain-containing protein [Armatimonas sp.]